MRSLLLAFIILCIPLTVCAGDPAMSKDEVLRLGESMYRKGILPSGEKMKAVVQDDIEVDGSMFTCVSCHLRSGMGTVEGTVFSLPTNGKNLFSPLLPGHDNPGLPSSFKGKPAGVKMYTPWYKPEVSPRPAYTDKTLADALRMGVDPTGRRFASTMPIYFLDDKEVNILISYLKALSSEYSPGVTGKAMRFAAIVTEGISDGDREAMLVPLRIFMDLKNSRYDVMKNMRRAMAMKDTAYRELTLEVWELKGAPETWERQLEHYYKKGPVFALLGGVAPGEWAPIHHFCERQGIPCILPATDFPVISDSDWYTLYLSKGLYQEAEAVASYLGGLPGGPKDTPVVQVFREGPEGVALSGAFKKIWETEGGKGPESIIIKKGEDLGRAFRDRLAKSQKNAALVLWLKAGDFSSVADMISLLEANRRPRSIFVSATLLKEKMYSLPGALRELTYITYPYRHPEDPLPQQMMGMSGVLSAEAWLKSRGLKSANPDISSKMFLLSQLLTEVIMHMQNNFYRDYFLDVFDMMVDQLISADYPRLSFGPGQRYAMKGCYIVQLSGGEKPALIKRSEWVTH